MEIISFDSILTSMCDTFDNLIKPKKLARTNKNIIYLLLKAIAKGYEIINNTCVALDNKFDPLYCSDEDLDSVALLVGTERLKGSGSGLHILATNTSTQEVLLLKGTYQYAFNDDIIFQFTLNQDTILGTQTIEFLALSTEIGRYPVELQTNIKVTADVAVSDLIIFSCTNNEALLGIQEETNLEFRNRIMQQQDRQNSLVELETEIKNLPYLFDCKIFFNPEVDTVTVDEVPVPAYQAAIFYSGLPDNEIASIIEKRIIFPTVQTTDSVQVISENKAFASGYFRANIIPFRYMEYSVSLTYKLDVNYTTSEAAQGTIRSILITELAAEKHFDYVKEADIYDITKTININGVEILGLNLVYDGENVDYIEVPASRIPKLVSVTFTEISVI